MSAKKAAAALLECDVELYQFAESMKEEYSSERREKIVNFMSGYLLGTWTLTLAARAAGADEEQVVAAILYALAVGSTAVCRGEAARMYR
jgi:hypothetical protein